MAVSDEGFWTRGEVFTYETDKAIVRIHRGQLNREEFYATLEAAARKLYEDIRKSNKEWKP